MAQEIVNSILHAQGLDPLDLVEDGPNESDLDGDEPEKKSSNKRFELKARFRAIYANLIEIKIEICLKRLLFPEKMGEVASFCFFS